MIECFDTSPSHCHLRQGTTTRERSGLGITRRVVLDVWSVTVAALAWLVLVTGAVAKSDDEPNATPPFAVRELYAPAHFGNSYEVMGQYETRKYIEEAKHWGFNRYGDWFDMQDCSDPFAETEHVAIAHAMWERKKQNFLSAQALGLSCDLVITPNHVYVDQCRPELLARQGGRILGQLICPSNPTARTIILQNYDNLFADLAHAGVRLNSISACPYDFGGCGCDRCKPWIITFGKLSRDIHAVAKRYYPDVELDMIGWWWTPEEHRQLADWADEESPGLIKAMYLNIPYGVTKVADVRLPKGCQKYAFVHIGYADQDAARDQYGHLGPVIAPVRLPQTICDLLADGAGGFMAYSEGAFDDANKALLAGLGAGKFQTADEVLRSYAQRYFAADAQQAADWSKWLTAWGSPFGVDSATSAAQLACLKKDGQWRERQWELKLELFRLNRSIGAGNDWSPSRLAAVDQFWQVQEQIHRGLWGLTLQRHIFDRRFTPVPWYADWANQVEAKAATLGKEQ